MDRSISTALNIQGAGDNSSRDHKLIHRCMRLLDNLDSQCTERFVVTVWPLSVTNLQDKIFAAGLCCGLSCLGSGLAIGITGDAGVRGVGQQGKLYVGLVLIQIFSEALGLYGFIVSLVLAA